MDTVRVGLLGLGIVGSQVAERLECQRGLVTERTGGPVELSRVLVRDTSKRRAYVPTGARITTDPAAVLEDPAIGVVIELMGGMEPARTYIERAIDAGKAVVTANKEVMAHHGPELLDLAKRRGVDVYF
jgi:homoserine dehydrogenase